MQHLTNLVLFIRDNNSKTLIMTKLCFPALIAFDISATTSPRGLIPFVAAHSKLEQLRFKFRDVRTRMSFQPQDLPKMRALKLGMDLEHIFVNFLGSGDTEKAEELCARRPLLEHLFIDRVDSSRSLRDYLRPFSRQLRRLDLEDYKGKSILRDGLYKLLESFTALVEMSIIITGPRDAFKRATVLSAKELRNILRSLNGCASFRAIHLFDVE
ncbi:hypothetical protein SCHPADRAFT_562009 [Schizopora paradoxa]|uniref:Uncharacterized protein n=1 Tax=Schizopora paradoxa TaxID=27342 RepID=A0A0H2RCH2_9AGAM|nr:hypothetical protein SCHPADRAFT_562009 [Schizopora paradoxa]